jgi:hypothetical protein
MLTAIVNALQFPVVVQFAPKQPPCHSSRDNAALRNDNSFRIFKLTPLHRLEIADFRFAARLSLQSSI